MAIDKISEIIDYLNKKEMEEFQTFSNHKKAMSIFKHFVGYYKEQEKSFKAKDKSVKDRSDVETERHFTLASKQLKSLSKDEVVDYLQLIKEKLSKVVENNNENNLVGNSLLFRTIVRQLPSTKGSEVESLRNDIMNLLDELNFQLEK